MNFMRKNWYYVGGGLFAVLAVVLGIFWKDISLLRKVMWISFMALLVHQFEEYVWPGGFPAVMNIAWHPSGAGKPDRYPLNQQSALFVNVFFAYPFYILPIIFPGLIWLGLAQVLFGMAQFGVHGIIINRILRSFYNPGLFVVVFFHLPIGTYYIWYIYTHGLAPLWIWPVAIVLVALAAVFGVDMPVTRWFADHESPYPFSEKMMAHFRVREKMDKIISERV
jgi:hypothetical protein